jgi:hypothetical protein
MNMMTKEIFPLTKTFFLIPERKFIHSLARKGSSESEGAVDLIGLLGFRKMWFKKREKFFGEKERKAEFWKKMLAVSLNAIYGSWDANPTLLLLHSHIQKELLDLFSSSLLEFSKKC